MPTVSLSARIPVVLEAPEPMRDALEHVLGGEYEAGYSGHGLTVLDIGANVGSFAIWAHLRWPQSTIHAYEPHPETARMLASNVRLLSNVVCHQCAVYPSEQRAGSFFTRYAGDGESGLASYMNETFASFKNGQLLQVPILHPRLLPPADVVKIDAEGAEADILRAMSLRQVSLILLEFQCDRNRKLIKDRLSADFEVLREEEHRWDELLRNAEYREDLAGDFYGLLFMGNRHLGRLGKLSQDNAAAG
jgi:FkbM family methyltransferase